MGETSGRLGGLAGCAAAVLLAAALAAMPTLPGTAASGPDVFEFFLTEGDGVRNAAALLALALLLSAGLFASLRLRLIARGAVGAGAGLAGFALLAIAVQAFAAAVLTTLALRPEQADPATARSLLDLVEIGVGISGLAYALAAGTLLVARRRAPGSVPGRIAALSALLAVGTLLWAARLVTDAGALDAGSFLGSTLGWLLLIAWLIDTGIWVLTEGGTTAPDRTPATGAG